MENNYIRTLGIDIGIASIGWALIEDRGEIADSPAANPKHDIQIIDSGVRIFTTPQNDSGARHRRQMRSMRKSTRRKRNRILQVKKYLARALDLELEALLGESDRLSPIFQTSKEFVSPWQLRVDALYRRLGDSELARVILHIAKRRGYDDKAYRMSEDDDDRVIAKAISANKELRKAHNYRTIGEMLCKSYFMRYREGSKDFDNVRNHSKDKENPTAAEKAEGYKRCVGRSELRYELKEILDSQERLGNPRITPELRARLLGDDDASNKDKREGLIFYQRPLKSFEDKIGYCIHLPKEKRAPKGSPSAERFVALTRIINTLNYIVDKTGIVWDIPALIKQILEEAHKLKSGVTYAKLRTILGLPEAFEFRELRYIKDKPENEKFIALESTHKLQAANPDLPIATQDKIATILSANKDWNVIESLLKDFLTPEQVENIKEAKLNFSHHINISLKALEHLLPLMEQGESYDKAKEKLENQGVFPPQVENKMKLLPPLSEAAKEDSYFDINNPVVTRAVSEFRKVLNAVIEKHGKLHYCNVELAREVGASENEREMSERKRVSNATANTKAAEMLVRELGITNPSPSDILRAKLWVQQDYRCIYTGTYIDLRDLLDGDKIHIDHVLPYSRSFDNSQSNKVLCTNSANSNKGNQTPWEYMKNDPEGWANFQARVNATKFDKKKKEKILKRKFNDREWGFSERALNDTRHISRAISLYLKRYLDFAPIEGKKNHVRICSGALTSALRRHWGLEEKDRSHHLHHAQDAVIIACVTDRVIKKYNDFLTDKEAKMHSKEEKEQMLEGDYKTKIALRQPTPNLSDKIKVSITKIQVSHYPSHKITGALHRQKPQKRQNFYETYGGEAGLQKAIAMGKVREINGGIVGNVEMVRVDVFKSKDKGKFYAVPIYTFDFATGKLPNKAIVQGKDKDGTIKDWLEMDENYEFCFSLFKNDAVLIQTKDMESPVVAIYKGTDAMTGGMTFEHHSRHSFGSKDEELFFTDKDKATQKPLYSKRGCGIQGLKHFSKVSISPIGELKELKPSKRQWLQNKDSKKNPKNV